MDYVIGRIPRPGMAQGKTAREGQSIEAKVLHVREPRRRQQEAVEGEDRRKSSATDPPGARVLVVLVPDAYRLPEDIEQGDYRVFLRFVRK